MTTENPFKITVFDKAFVRKAIVSTPIELRAIPRHNLKGTATFSLALDHPALGDLMAAGSRVVIHYRGKQVMSGPVTERSINGPSITGNATFMVEDDFRILHGLLGWQVPGNPITDQSIAERYVISGPAETVVKTAISVNKARLGGLNLTIAPDLGRGANITLEMRMETMFEKFFPMVETAGLGVRIYQEGAGLVLDVYEPSTYAPLLSEESGIVQSWSWTNSSPKATNLVMGGRGEDTDREFRTFSDPAAISEWGLIVERFEDATDVGSRLNDWYSRWENAMEDLARKTKDYTEDGDKYRNLGGDVTSLEGVKTTAFAVFPEGSSERAKAQADYNSAVSEKASQEAQLANALTAKDAAAAVLAGINGEYAAIRAEYEAQIASQAAEKLIEHSETTGVRMVLSETDGFRYGDAVSVGDRVSMKVGPNLSLTDVLREAELTWTFDSGVTATPSVGEITDNPDRAFAKALRNSVTRIRKIEVR